MRSRLLNARTIQFTPALAVAIGLNEAIILQQIHYWLDDSRHEHDGRKWIYNTYEEWQAQFPFMSRRVLIQSMKRLESAGLVVIHRFNKNNWDRTNWYSIEYDAVDALDDKTQSILADCEARKMKVITARTKRLRR